jgi:hypothetical protein
MAERLVVGLFYSSGIAEDAVHRLITEGVAARNIAHRVLKEAGPASPPLQPELADLDVDPLVIGNALQTFARFISDGETAVFVRAETDEEVEFAATTIKQYAPIAVEVVPPAGGAGGPAP